MGTLPTTLYQGSYSDFSGPAGSKPWVDRGVGFEVRGWMENKSRNNKWLDNPLRGSIDVGSNWFAVKSSFSPSLHHCDVVTSDGLGSHFGYRGPLVVDDGSLITSSRFHAIADGYQSSASALSAEAASMIARMIPTNPIADLPTAVGEVLTEGLPRSIGHSIRQRGKVNARSVADEYLNGVFGLQPLFRDLQAFSYARENAEAIIARYAENSGKMIRRKYEPPAQLTFVPPEAVPGNQLSPIKWSAVAGYLHSPSGGSYGLRTDSARISKRKWCKAAFCYYLPQGSQNELGRKLRTEIAEMRHLYGGINASTAWNLLPYSWAADWFTNAGDVIHNLSAFASDGLVMPWAYIMEETLVTQTRAVTGARIGNLVSGAQLPEVIETSFSVAIKQRRKVDPFSFGLDVGMLSNRQWSILVALGIAKGFR